MVTPIWLHNQLRLIPFEVRAVFFVDNKNLSTLSSGLGLAVNSCASLSGISSLTAPIGGEGSLTLFTLAAPSTERKKKHRRERQEGRSAPNTWSFLREVSCGVLELQEGGNSTAPPVPVNEEFGNPWLLQQLRGNMESQDTS